MKKNGERKIYNDKFPRKYITLMKRKKRKKLRNVPLDKHIIEKGFNDAKMLL
jgi:hypothetical protein